MAEAAVLSSQQIQQHLDSLVDTIVRSESVKPGEFALIGIRTHGATLAARMRDRLQARAGGDIDFGILDITLYRDDLGAGHPAPLVRSSEIDFDLEGKRVVLVDDVLFTGRTVRAAISALLDYGRPKYIRLAVLIDRGGRELPIEAQYVGARLDVPDDKRVKLRLKEDDGGVDEAVLVSS